MKEKTRNNRLILLLISMFLIISCSTKKKTYVNRKYHDITAKYNGYFNGNESLKYTAKERTSIIASPEITTIKSSGTVVCSKIK